MVLLCSKLDDAQYKKKAFRKFLGRLFRFLQPIIRSTLSDTTLFVL